MNFKKIGLISAAIFLVSSCGKKQPPNSTQDIPQVSFPIYGTWSYEIDTGLPDATDATRIEITNTFAEGRASRSGKCFYSDGIILEPTATVSASITESTVTFLDTTDGSVSRGDKYCKLRVEHTWEVHEH